MYTHYKYDIIGMSLSHKLQKITFDIVLLYSKFSMHINISLLSIYLFI